MEQAPPGIPVYLEMGSKRTFAGAVDWPGWCRSGRDEASALDAIVACGPRYLRVLRTVGLDLELPADASDLTVIERLQGNATTDFGSPGAVPSADERPVGADHLVSFSELLRACWLAFDGATSAAEGRNLRKGSRGGGRDLPAIIQHVTDANRAYLAKLAWKLADEVDRGPAGDLDRILDEVLNALTAAVAGKLPTQGPRGGELWLPRYFVRRVAWHMLDHAWEIEDRVS